MRKVILISSILLCFVMGCSAAQEGKEMGDLQNGLDQKQQTSYLNVEEGKISYHLKGKGPLIVLIPGIGDLRQTYRFLEEELVDAGYSVASMDLRGHGESSVNWSGYSAVDTGKDILALLNELNLGKATLVGNSMAGAAALWASVESPEQVESVILINAFVRDLPMPWYKKALFKVLLAKPWGISAWGKAYESAYVSHQPDDLQAYKANLLANLKEEGRYDAMREMLWTSKQGVEKHFDEVKVRPLVIVGSQDQDFDDPLQEASWIAERFGGTQVVINNAGHYPHAEMPKETAKAILQFLNY